MPLRHRDDLAGAQIEGGTWTHADRLLDEDKRKPRAGQDLRGYGFRTIEELGLDFARANLRHADFMLAKLYECDFRGADLTGANLHGASFQSCKFQGAILSGELLLELRYDESSIPTEHQPDDPFSDEDLVQVFVARGLFHRCEGSEISMLEAAGMVPTPNRTVAFYNQVTPALREQLTRVLTAHAVHRYLVYEKSILVTIWNTEELLAQGMPFSMLVDVARLVAAAAVEVKPLDHWVEVGPGHAGAFTLVDCTFCGSRFGLDGRAKCPNCGGGYAGNIP